MARDCELMRRKKSLNEITHTRMKRMRTMEMIILISFVNRSRGDNCQLEKKKPTYSTLHADRDIAIYMQIKSDLVIVTDMWLCVHLYSLSGMSASCMFWFHVMCALLQTCACIAIVICMHAARSRNVQRSISLIPKIIPISTISMCSLYMHGAHNRSMFFN